MALLRRRPGRLALLAAGPDQPIQRSPPQAGLDTPYRRQARSPENHDPVHADRDRRGHVPDDGPSAGSGAQRGDGRSALELRSLRGTEVFTGAGRESRRDVLRRRQGQAHLRGDPGEAVLHRRPHRRVDQELRRERRRRPETGLRPRHGGPFLQVHEPSGDLRRPDSRQRRRRRRAAARGSGTYPRL